MGFASPWREWQAPCSIRQRMPFREDGLISSALHAARAFSGQKLSHHGLHGFHGDAAHVRSIRIGSDAVIIFPQCSPYSGRVPCGYGQYRHIQGGSHMGRPAGPGDHGAAGLQKGSAFLQGAKYERRGLLTPANPLRRG